MTPITEAYEHRRAVARARDSAVGDSEAYRALQAQYVEVLGWIRRVRRIKRGML